ncbi:MAG: ABC transporter ATP-binding protein [Candidatus Thorarchaeota archaeon]|nr:ABC transporter ATP-binding protein [Candidatus Thorarchaeota archaeon]
MIILDDVHFSYEGLYTALRGVSIQIDDGESVAIMGSNGAGKTTLIKHLNGLLRPDCGRVIVDGVDARRLTVAELSRVIGLVWQNPDHQLFLDTVRKEVVFGLQSLGFSKEESEDRCSHTLERLGLSHLSDRSPFALSGGERKRVALASVLATEPRVLALDEPTIGQDAEQKRHLAEMLTQMNREGRTVVVVTHDIEFVIENFKRTIAMSDGRVVADGRTSSVLSNEAVLEMCSLSPPQMTIAARSLSRVFSEVSPRITSLDELEASILRVLGAV